LLEILCLQAAAATRASKDKALAAGAAAQHQSQPPLKCPAASTEQEQPAAAGQESEAGHDISTAAAAAAARKKPRLAQQPQGSLQAAEPPAGASLQNLGKHSSSGSLGAGTAAQPSPQAVAPALDGPAAAAARLEP
jgi:hypothetical protein